MALGRRQSSEAAPGDVLPLLGEGQTKESSHMGPCENPWPLFLSYFEPYRSFLLVIVLQGNCLILLEL